MERSASHDIERTAEQAKNETDWLAFISSVSATLNTTPASGPHALSDLSSKLLQLRPRVSATSSPTHGPPPSLHSAHSHQPSPTASFHIGSETKDSRSTSVPPSNELSDHQHGSGIASSSGLPHHPQHPSTSSQAALSHLMDQITFPPVYDPSLHLHYPVSPVPPAKRVSPPLPASGPSDFHHPFFPPPSSTFSPPTSSASGSLPYPPLHIQTTTNHPQHTFPHNPIYHTSHLPHTQSHSPTGFLLPPTFTFGSAAPSPLEATPTSPPRSSQRGSVSGPSRGRPSRGRSTSSQGGRTHGATAASSTDGSPPVAIQALGEEDGGVGGEMDGEDVEEDKRRRNTEASARFRAKKKAKTINLTRTVSDLNGRVQELEVEAGELRNENKWLKQLVLTKAQGGGGGGAGG